ncbi:hypothetical protein [Microseira wollei]|uniref:hypothetical protein n=1 Tax=Microseira wollei TaxID=467598 RepID=UPI001CFDF2F5|nr:hypothetical protein [Microseira wollei]
MSHITYHLRWFFHCREIDDDPAQQAVAAVRSRRPHGSTFVFQDKSTQLDRDLGAYSGFLRKIFGLARRD